MARFLQDSDYEAQIKSEIRKLIDGSTPSETNPYKLLKAEAAAIDQVRNWLANRVNCDQVFTPATETEDKRDKFIVMLTIDLTLYHLYSQTPNKDVPTHRQARYEDALDWLKKAGRGEIGTNLPSNLSDESPGEIRMWSKKQENHDW